MPFTKNEADGDIQSIYDVSIREKWAPAGVQEVAYGTQQLEGLVANGDVAQRWWEGYVVLESEVINLKTPLLSPPIPKLCHCIATANEAAALWPNTGSHLAPNGNTHSG